MILKNKKVLIVTYYWPPSGGSGVQRWLKFVKYLPQFGFEPYVFTPENPSFAIRDNSLLSDVPPEAEIIHFPIWEPYDTFFNLSRVFGQRKSARPTDLVSTKKRSVFQRVSTWIRGNFFIPDPRVFWVKPSVTFLLDFLAENEIRTLVTTGPPHSIHLIGLKLKKRNPSLRWVADFRDPWSAWGLLDSLHVSSWARRYHQRLEQQVLSRADEVITITPFFVRHFETLGNRRVQLVTNGFDEDDFKDIARVQTDKFIIRHVGIVNEKCDPRSFMEAVHRLVTGNKTLAGRIRIEFTGEVHAQFKEYVAARPALSEITSFAGNIPHKKLLELYGASSLLLLVLTGYKDAEGYLPGKLFEYLATSLPVLGVGPAAGDAAHLLRETKAGVMIESSDIEGIKKEIEGQFNNWNSGSHIRAMTPEIQKYSRKETARALTRFLIR